MGAHLASRKLNKRVLAIVWCLLHMYSMPHLPFYLNSYIRFHMFHSYFLLRSTICNRRPRQQWHLRHGESTRTSGRYDPRWWWTRRSRSPLEVNESARKLGHRADPRNGRSRMGTCEGRICSEFSLPGGARCFHLHLYHKG